MNDFLGRIHAYHQMPASFTNRLILLLHQLASECVDVRSMYKTYGNKFHPNANANTNATMSMYFEWHLHVVVCFFPFSFRLFASFLYCLSFFFVLFVDGIVYILCCVLHFIVFWLTVNQILHVYTVLIRIEHIVNVWLFGFFFCFSSIHFAAVRCLQTRLKLKIKKRLALFRIPDLIGHSHDSYVPNRLFLFAIADNLQEFITFLPFAEIRTATRIE